MGSVNMQSLQTEMPNAEWIVSSAIVVAASLSIVGPVGTVDMMGLGNTSTPIHQTSAALGPPSLIWQELSENEDWTAPLNARISVLVEEVDGWKGNGSVAASEKAIRDAFRFVTKLMLEGATIKPKIGLDDDGAFAFFWRTDEFVADLSIYGDGTYSFFAKRRDQVASSDEEKLTDAIPYQFLNMLTV